MARIFLYKSKDEKSHKELGKKLSELPEGGYVIKVSKNKPVRSLGQNAYYHMVWNIYATHTGHYIDELKKEFYDKIGFFEVFTDKREISTKRYKSSADLDETEFAALINQQAQWGRDEFPEVIVPRKEDATYLQWMQVENDYNRTFSGW
jgi:hypothetical protein